MFRRVIWPLLVVATNFGHPCYVNCVSANLFSVSKNRTSHSLWSTELSGARRNLLFWDFVQFPMKFFVREDRTVKARRRTEQQNQRNCWLHSPRANCADDTRNRDSVLGCDTLQSGAKNMYFLQKANLHETTRRHNPEDRKLHNYRRGSLQSFGGSKVPVFWVTSVHSSVSIVTALWAGCSSNSGSNPGSGKTFIPSPKPPDRLWRPPSLFDYRGSFRWGKRTGAWTWPFTSHLEPSLRIKGANSPLPDTSSWWGEEHLYLDEILTNNPQDN